MIELIKAATQPVTNQQRCQAEKKLIRMREEQPIPFFTQITQCFKNIQIQSALRSSTGTILAASITSKRKNGTFLWDALDGNDKNLIRTSILTVIIDSQRNVRRAAANIVSAICFIQLPRNQWNDIVDKLAQNINNENQVVREVSILTLGFICERLKDIPNFSFPIHLQQSILAGIALGLKGNDPEMIRIALKALRDSVGSLSQLMQRPQSCKFLLGQAGKMAAGQQYPIQGLQILGQFVKYNYTYIGTIMNDLFNLLQPIITNPKNEDVCVAATEIWENLAAQYSDSDSKSAQNHISGDIGTQIITILLKNLCYMNEEQDSQNDVVQSTSKALQTIFDNGSNQYKELVINFVTMTIDQNDWRLRQASVKAFSLLLNGLSNEQSNKLVDNSFEKFLSLLNDQSLAVQNVTIQSIAIITEFCGLCVLKRPNFLQYLELIMGFLNKSQKFFKDICKILENLCEAAKNNKMDTFYDISQKIVEAILNTCLNPQTEMIIINVGVSTLMTVIETARNQHLSTKYIVFFLDSFPNLKSVQNTEKRDLLKSCFFSLIQTCLLAMRGSENVNFELLTRVYQLITNYFQAIKDVTYDGIYTASALTHFFFNDDRFLDDFWQYILHALQKVQEPQLFKANLSCIADFVLCYKDKMSSKFESFVPTLLGLLQEPAFNRDLKIDILNCLSEVFLNCGQHAKMYLQNFMNIIMLCCQGAIQMVPIDFAYSQSLKEAIIQSLTCIVHGMNIEQTNCPELEAYIPNIFKFIQMSTDKGVRPTVKFLSTCVSLLSDFANIYASVVKPQLSNFNFIPDLIKTLQKHNTNQEYTRLLKYAKEHLK